MDNQNTHILSVCADRIAVPQLWYMDLRIFLENQTERNKNFPHFRFKEHACAINIVYLLNRYRTEKELASDQRQGCSATQFVALETNFSFYDFMNPVLSVDMHGFKKGRR